jgi:nitroreductase/dihydropteridine reductase
MNHPIIQDLLWRHAVKKYDSNKKVSPQDLEVLTEAMRLTASSINSQPWRFVVIGTEEGKSRLFKTFDNKFQFNQKHVFDSSHIILFSYNPYYTRNDYAVVVDKGIQDKRTKIESRDAAFGSFAFAEMNTDADGYTGHWTKAQTYIALGNTLHTLSRLRIDSTPLEGVDSELVNKEFKTELGGYHCDVALAIGYHHTEDDYNQKLPKSRHHKKDIFTFI